MVKNYKTVTINPGTRVIITHAKINNTTVIIIATVAAAFACCVVAFIALNFVAVGPVKNYMHIP